VIGVDRPQVEQRATGAPEPAESATQVPESDVADPVSVQVPEAGIDTSLVPVGLQSDGAMELPDPGTGAWYELGPRPGEDGPAVLIGHVDSVDGPDVFFGLSAVETGDVVHVGDVEGVRRTFVVTGVETVRKDTLPYERIWAETDEPVLRLITCGGLYDRANGGYQHNVVVYAELLPC
jgi:sortase (surface protein transpeptidase)